MEGRISATGLKFVELDELTTNQIIINNEGLQYKHKYYLKNCHLLCIEVHLIFQLM